LSRERWLILYCLSVGVLGWAWLLSSGLREPPWILVLLFLALALMVESAGFRVRAWDNVTAETAGTTPGTAAPPYGIQQIVMGERLAEITRAGARNREEGRLVSVQAVFERTC
jgi:hypothetical protein